MCVPRTVESYIHVAGRTGRVSAPGKVSSVLTQQELDRAGLITRSVRGVKFRLWHWNAEDRKIEPHGGRHSRLRRTVDMHHSPVVSARFVE